MVELETFMPRLEIFNQFGRIRCIDYPNSRLVLDWVEQLDGHQVVELIVGTALGWLTISEVDEEMYIGFCDPQLEKCDSRLISRQDALLWLVEVMQYQGLPA